MHWNEEELAQENIGKQKYQEKEHGKALLVMEKIKQALDPDTLFNPNKILKIKI